MATADILKNLDPQVQSLLEPENVASHEFRRDRIDRYLTPLGNVDGAGFFDRDMVIETLYGTQFDGESHRCCTPFWQAMFSQTRSILMNQIDLAVASSLRYDPYPPKNFDYVIVGTGPHGAAVAANLREMRPNCTILMIDNNAKIGGQFRSYGPKPAFMMNSRVRKADRTIPGLPRTPGNINPLGMYAPLELSDIPVGNYAMNTDLGDVCAINCFLSANFFLTEANVTKMSTLSVEFEMRERGLFSIYARKGIINATGIGQRSTLPFDSTSGRSGLFRKLGNFLDIGSLYRHFANDPNPLRMFHDRTVTVVGGGDSALTAIEAILGNLPTETYGSMGVGRCRPRTINWLGAPRNTTEALSRCLRSRYKNGIVQALQIPSNERNGYLQDRGFLINPILGVGLTVEPGNSPFGENSLMVRYEFGAKRYGRSRRLLPSDVVIDCTNEQQAGRVNPSWFPRWEVGPAAQREPNFRTQELIRQLRIPENTASLWATMPYTDAVSRDAAEATPFER